FIRHTRWMMRSCVRQLGDNCENGPTRKYLYITLGPHPTALHILQICCTHSQSRSSDHCKEQEEFPVRKARNVGWTRRRGYSRIRADGIALLPDCFQTRKAVLVDLPEADTGLRLFEFLVYLGQTTG